MQNERKPRIRVTILNEKRKMSIEATSYSELVHRAMDRAAAAHDGHYRKEPDRKVPYVSHCAMVGRLLERAGFDEIVVAAGILHDAVEDTDLTREDLAVEFGDDVANLVAGVTEQDKSLPWAERKSLYLDQLRQGPEQALAIACADKIHNLWSLILYRRAGMDPWVLLKSGREAQIARFEAMAALFRERFDHKLARTFYDTLETVKNEC
jgi:(p)ppGpp synthase/HD superfamily hydrolase